MSAIRTLTRILQLVKPQDRQLALDLLVELVYPQNPNENETDLQKPLEKAEITKWHGINCPCDVCQAKT